MNMSSTTTSSAKTLDTMFQQTTNFILSVSLLLMTILLIVNFIRLTLYIKNNQDEKIPGLWINIFVEFFVGSIFGAIYLSNHHIHMPHINNEQCIIICLIVGASIFIGILIKNIICYQNFETFLHSTIREYAILMTIYAGCITVITHKFVLAISAFIIVIADLILLKLLHRLKEIQKND